jgi:hypothetical protein
MALLLNLSNPLQIKRGFAKKTYYTRFELSPEYLHTVDILKLQRISKDGVNNPNEGK